MLQFSPAGKHPDDLTIRLKIESDSMEGLLRNSPLRALANPNPAIEGAVSFFSVQCRGNPADHERIAVTSSSEIDPAHSPSRATDLSPSTSFVSQDAPDSWLTINFKASLVRPTRYLIRSAESAGPKSWVLESSMTGEKWVELDSRSDNRKLASPLATATFSISGQGQSAKFIRLRQTGPNHSGTSVLAVSLFDVIGGVTGAGRRYRQTPAPFDSAHPLVGIIAALTEECGGNVHRNGVVIVTGSTTLTGATTYHPEYAVNFNEDSLFASQNSPGSWLQYDFKEARVQVTHYTLKSGNYSNNLKNWALLGSDDGETWTTMHAMSENRQLEPHGAVVSFETKESPFIRFVRLSQTGLSHAGDHNLLCAAMELFGTLYRL
jgi:hypothetical protein